MSPRQRNRPPKRPKKQIWLTPEQVKTLGTAFAAALDNDSYREDILREVKTLAHDINDKLEKPWFLGP